MMFNEGFVLLVELAIIHVINSQTVVVSVQQGATVKLGKDANISCSYTILGAGSVLAWTWSNSTSNGDADTILIGSATTPAPDSRYSVDTSQADIITLIILNTMKSDKGFYQCTVILETTFASNNDFGELTVQFLDNVTIDISSTTAAENVIITCSANGTPTPMIDLTRNDSVIQTANNSILMYTIKSVKESDGGSYKCIATNNIDSKQSEPIVLNYFKPEVTLDNEELTVAPGKDNTITATVVANPVDITYKWTIDPEIVVTETSSSTFTFKVPESVENGTVYNVTVNVTNSIGSTTESAKVTVTNCVCVNGGTCSKDGTCICPEGFKGAECEVSDDDTNVIVIIFATLGGCVVLVGISFGGHRVYKSQNSKKPPKDPTSDPVVPQGDVEMKQPDSNSDLKRYAASGGDLYTQVSIKDKKKKPDSDNGSNKPTAVDLNVEGLQYADLDLTRNLPTDKKNVIHHPDQETTYSSIQLQPQQI